jgi:hypothetical protein
MPAHGRAGWAAVAIAVLAVSAPTAFTGDSEAKRKRCKASQVKQTVRYRKGGRRHKVTGCAPKPGAVPKTVASALPTVLRKTRVVAAKLAPRAMRRARKRKAARRVAKADRATDAALGRGIGPLAAAATVSTNTDRTPVTGPSGTRSTLTRTITERSGNEPAIGREGDLVIDTRSTRIGGSSKRKTVSFKSEMSRCPDAGGIGRGPVTYTQHDHWVVGDVVQDEVGRYSGEIVAHFGDDARIASVDVTGDWSWTTETRRSGRRVARHAVAGAAHSEGFSQSTAGGTVNNHVEVRTTVSTATDDGTAISGNYLGLFTAVMPDIFMEEALDGTQARALSGACVRVVPDPPEVHVAPASTVPIAAHLTDSGGATFAGTITTQHERVQPSSGDGHFTYASAASAPPGGYDIVRLDHTSKRGVASPGSVKVIYDSHAYRVLAAKLDESVTGERPPDFPACPASGSQTNTMSLGAQPLDPSTSSDGQLFDTGANYSGLIRAIGMSSMSSNVTGCDIGSTPTPCSGTGSAEVERDVTLQVDLPKAGGPARVQWFFNQDPAAGIGNESHGTCITYTFHGHAGDQSVGVRSVPRAIFESDGPANLSIEVQLDLPNDQGGEVHATERYALTIQRVSG